MSKSELKKKVGDESGNGKLFNDIEAISKALYLDKTQPRSSIPTISSRSKAVGKSQFPESKSKSKDSDEDPFQKDKKSIWSWKALKAFTHVRNKRFNCCFSLQVHSVEGLPPSFNDLSLSVHWKRRDGELMIRPSRVFRGIAEFDEELSYTCSVYGSRSGPHHSAKYEAKHFLLYASVVSMPELDLGKHRVDLTRLLPLTLEELEEEKSLGKWTTSYRLSGKAKGASMNVSFGYSVVGNSPTGPIRQSSTSLGKSGRFEQGSDRISIKRAGSLPARSHASSRSVEDIKDLHEVLPVASSELSASVDVLYQKFDEEKANVVDYEPEHDVIPLPLETVKHDAHSTDADKANVESEFSVVEHGIELSTKEQVKSEENALKACDGSELVAAEEDPKLDSLVKEIRSQTDEVVISECYDKEEDLCNKESLMKELESALSSVSKFVNEGSDSQEEIDSSNQEKYLDVKSDHEEGRKENIESDIQELGLALNSMSDLENKVPDSVYEESKLLNQEKSADFKSDYKGHRKGKSLSLDYATESVACDFLDMLGIDHSPFGLSSESEPDSPRERLLRQFEKDALANGGGFLNFDIGEEEADFGCDTPSGWGPISEECDLSSVIQASEEMLKLGTQEVRSKTRASLLEDMETEALMREWGLNETSFQRSRSNSPRGFGSPIDISPEEPVQLPPLGEGLGPFVQTSNGGFLRSMNPELFRNAKSGGNLIMQVSSPVVVPAEMGSGIMDILQGLASVGIEKLSMQANKLMPLEDITGKTMQQIAWEAAPTLEAPERQVLEGGESASRGQTRVKGKPSGGRSSKYEASSIANAKDSEFVSLGDLAPLAMDKIEALSIEGLRIQSGMSDEEAPSNISPQSIGDISALEGKRVDVGGSLGLEGAGGLQLLDIKDCGDDVDGIMGLSLTLDEWMRLDSGEIDDEDGISERTSKILAAHHASDLMRARTGERKRGKGSRRGGLLGNNFTVALMVQLRDPLRNFEPVGTPMLALIQVERVFVPPKPKICSTVSELWKCSEDEDEPQPVKKEEINEEEQKVHEEEANSIAQFKITEVHVAGLKTEPTKKKLWGSNSQQQSGSRWLLANGMGKKNNKHPLMKSKAATKSSSSPGDSLWSISSKQKESAKQSPHVRNPNVIVPNETMKLLSGVGFL